MYIYTHICIKPFLGSEKTVLFFDSMESLPSDGAVDIHPHEYIYLYIGICIHVYVMCMYICTYVYLQHVDIHMYIHITYICTYTYI